MRPSLLNPLFADVTGLKGVGSAIAAQLKRLAVTRVLDLLFHLPAGVVERVRLDDPDAAFEGRAVTLELEVKRHDPGRGRVPTRITALSRGSVPVTLVYFGDAGHYARRLLPVGETRYVSGRLERFGQGFQIVHPDHVAARVDEIPEREPVYPLTGGLTNRRVAGLVQAAMERLPELAEWIGPRIIESRGWPSFGQALARIHGGADDPAARDRLAYDELLAGQLALLLVRMESRRRSGRALQGTGRLTQPWEAGLPFAMTGAQTRSLAEIRGDMAAATPMLRLLQGDVGSGKTLVALGAALTAVEAGAQVAFLAPTEILARQHLATFDRLLFGLPVRTALLTAREKGTQRDELLAGLAQGQIDIVLGTHAIFQEAVAYHDLGLVIVDEQHRFGVEQRMTLSRKAKVPPHVLAMTATPIPRTLTLTRFGEMDVSRLDERPPGRKPVETRVVSMERVGEVVDGLARHIGRGGQAYWVCPLIGDAEADAMSAAAEARAAELAQRFGREVGLVHGQMPGAERDRVMADFAQGRIRLLVATTVIEVGVDVPAATLMVVEQAERFGLAQLHQLRGRVGRGEGRSTCVLLRSPTLSETARARLALMRSTDDGFLIAEEDLKLRGGGELLGVRQSGDPAFRLADLAQATRLLELARDDARRALAEPGSPRAAAATILLHLFERDAAAGFLQSG
jgi:ATP-dependent DNA helicase RecG